MGTYLVTGIVQKIIIDKRDIVKNNIRIEDVSDKIKEGINLDYYTLKEEEDFYSWNISPNILEKGLNDFLEDQFDMYYRDRKEWPEDLLKIIKETSTGEELISLASQKRFEHFQQVTNIEEDVLIMLPSGFNKRIEINYNLIAFFIDGKIIMECYSNILRYFDKNIRLQKEKHPIVDCIKTCITT
jgi:hypothetical protein